MTQPVDPIAYAGPAPALVNPDVEHLRLLSIFHWVVGPLELVMGSIPVIHLVLGILMVSGGLQPATSQPQQPDMAWVGWFFIAFASLFILFGWTLGLLTLYSGFQLRARRRRTLSIVVAAVNCLLFPFGTALGVFTLVVLLRRSMEDLYRQPV